MLATLISPISMTNRKLAATMARTAIQIMTVTVKLVGLYAL